MYIRTYIKRKFDHLHLASNRSSTHRRRLARLTWLLAPPVAGRRASRLPSTKGTFQLCTKGALKLCTEGTLLLCTATRKKWLDDLRFPVIYFVRSRPERREPCTGQAVYLAARFLSHTFLDSNGRAAGECQPYEAAVPDEVEGNGGFNAKENGLCLLFP